jgi:hypothetical protein
MFQKTHKSGIGHVRVLCHSHSHVTEWQLNHGQDSKRWEEGSTVRQVCVTTPPLLSPKFEKLTERMSLEYRARPLEAPESVKT